MQNIKLGLDCPTGWLERLYPFTDYDYVLVDKALRDFDYRSFFMQSEKPKILNNRIMKQWEPLPLNDIKRVWDILGGSVIAPDWMWDHESTLNAYEECCNTFGEENVIGVVQGIERDEIDACLDFYGERIAIPFDVGSAKEDPPEIKVKRRIQVVNALGDRRIHLLGLVHPSELREYGSSSPVESLNTGLPVLLALQGKHIRDFEEDKKHSSYHSLDMDTPMLTDAVYQLILNNIGELKEWTEL